MADYMSFPKEPMEFIKDSSFVDREEVYTNGSELVPLFRVEQMLEHYYKPLKDKQEQGLLIELPCKVGDTVYVITTCGNVELVMDGSWETATGYYCPFELYGQCPHDCEDCKDVKNNLAVFEETVSYIGIDETGIHIFTGETGTCCTIGLNAFLTRFEAEEALAKMGE